MEAIAIAMMVDQGHMSYDDLVATHWPEYGVHGKENVTIADVMRHEGGTPYVQRHETLALPHDESTATHRTYDIRISAITKVHG